MDHKEQIRNRFKEYVLEKYGTVYNLTKATGIPQSSIKTITGSQGSLPGSELLFRLKTCDPCMDLNYIISGEPLPEQTTEQKVANIEDLTKTLLFAHHELISKIEKIIAEK